MDDDDSREAQPANRSRLSALTRKKRSTGKLNGFEGKEEKDNMEKSTPTGTADCLVSGLVFNYYFSGVEVLYICIYIFL